MTIQRPTFEKLNQVHKARTPQEAEALAEAAATRNGFEFLDLGDEWGWRNRHECVEGAGGFPTKAEAWADIKQNYVTDEEDEPSAEGPAEPSIPQDAKDLILTMRAALLQARDALDLLHGESILELDDPGMSDSRYAAVEAALAARARLENLVGDGGSHG